MPKKKKTKESIPPEFRMKEPAVLYRFEVPKRSKSKLYFFDKRYYFNITRRSWMKHIPGTWDNGPVIYKVPLYPEQAVLSCCSAATGAFTSARFAVITPTNCQLGAPAGANYCLGETLAKAKCNWLAGVGNHEISAQSS